MKLERVSQEFAKDWIELVNSLKGFKYNAHVNYTTKNGSTTKFDYITLDKIYDEAKKNNNFAITEPLGTDESGDSALKVLVIHRTGEIVMSDYYKLRVNEQGSKQDEGAAITYTKRYALGSFLGISTDQDNDANPDGKGMPVAKKEKLVSEPQLKLLARLNEEQVSKVLEKYNVKEIKELTMKDASEIINRIKASQQKQISNVVTPEEVDQFKTANELEGE